MTDASSRQQALKQALPALIAFALGLTLAWWFNWQTTDLIWSLWLSSLVTGYLTILVAIGAGLFSGRSVLQHEKFRAKKGSAVAGGIGLSLFLLVFFSIHFCGFHAGHALFLNSFYPIPGIPEDAFSADIMNPLVLWKTAIMYVVPAYGLFLIPILINERKRIFSPLLRNSPEMERTEIPEVKRTEIKNTEINSTEGSSDTQNEKNTTENDRDSKYIKNIFVLPYINVVRLHLLIFFFAASEAIKLDTFYVMIVVYAVYFFPWELLFHRNRNAAAANKETADATSH